MDVAGKPSFQKLIIQKVYAWTSVARISWASPEVKFLIIMIYPVASKQPEASSGRFLELAEKALKAAGLLAVVGYLALRAHWNQLGIPVVTGVETDRYIAEFYVLFSDLLFRLEVYAILVGTVILVGGVLWSLSPLTSAREGLAARLGKIGKGRPSNVVPAVLLGLLLGLLFWLLRAMTELVAKGGGQPVALGVLKPVVQIRSMGSQVFDSLLVWVVLSTMACWMIPRLWKRGSPLPWTWHACRVVVVILGLHLPILYGSFVRDSRYPRVSWKAEGEEPQCGLLVLQTAEKLSVWTADEGQGKLIVLPGKSEKAKLTMGEPADLFETIDRAAQHEVDLKLCPVQSGR